MVSLGGHPRTRRELLARVGRLDQVAGVQLVEARHLHRTLQELAAVGAAQDSPVLRGVAISPGTPVQAIDWRRLLDQPHPAASQPNPVTS
jgi:hypothetical protein